jgi:hypothetical protein
MPVKAELSAARRKKRRARQYHISAAAPDYDANQGARFEVYFTKHRGFYGPEAQPFEARLIEGRWHTCNIQRDSDEETMRALQKQSLSIRDIADRLGVSKSTVSRKLNGGEE